MICRRILVFALVATIQSARYDSSETLTLKIKIQKITPNQEIPTALDCVQSQTYVPIFWRTIDAHILISDTSSRYISYDIQIWSLQCSAINVFRWGRCHCTYITQHSHIVLEQVINHNKNLVWTSELSTANIYSMLDYRSSVVRYIKIATSFHV